MTLPFTLHTGDCLAALAAMPDNSFDAVVTDPPYGLGREPDALAMLRDWLTTGHHEVKGSGFMGKAWDAFVPQPVLWAQVLRVLKPGGHVVAFAGTRTMDLMMLGMRIAGFEMRDSIGYAHGTEGAPLLAWCYGSGFPKSLDAGKAIDKALGAEREVIGSRRLTGTARIVGGQGGASSGRAEELYATNDIRDFLDITAPSSAEARKWQGWGTALKPAWEPIILARKPLDGTVAANVLKHGTGAVNVDGCRVEGLVTTNPLVRNVGGYESDGLANQGPTGRGVESEGRWPANLTHDGSAEVLAGFPETKGQIGGNNDPNGSMGYHGGARWVANSGIPDSGSAARFFYCAKASKEDREAGLREAGLLQFTVQSGCGGDMPTDDDGKERDRFKKVARNIHPTVKPTALMRWLVRLVTPPGGTILDPFTGSGSTGRAAILEGFRFVGCELSPEYVAIAEARIRAAMLDRDVEAMIGEDRAERVGSVSVEPIDLFEGNLI